jgi:hypothetical protein
MRRTLPCAIALVVASARAEADSGFTAEAALGAGLVLAEDGGGIGASGLSLGVGRQLSAETSLTLRFAPTTVFVETTSGGHVRASIAFLGLTVQHRIADRLFVGGGAGAMVLDDDRDRNDRSWSGGLDLRAGYVLHTSRHVVLHTGLEATGGAWFASEHSTAVVTSLSWQIGAQLR